MSDSVRLTPSIGESGCIKSCNPIESASMCVAIVALLALSTLFYARSHNPNGFLFLYHGIPAGGIISTVFVASLIVFVKNFYKIKKNKIEVFSIQNYEIIDTNIQGANLFEICKKAHVIGAGDRHSIVKHHERNSDLVKEFWIKDASLLLTESPPKYYQQFLPKECLSNAERWDINTFDHKPIWALQTFFLHRVLNILQLREWLKNNNLNSEKWMDFFHSFELSKITTALKELEELMPEEINAKIESLEKLKNTDNIHVFRDMLQVWADFDDFFSLLYGHALEKSWLQRQKNLNNLIQAKRDKFEKLFIFAGLSHLEENVHNPLQTQATRLIKETLGDTPYVFLRPSNKTTTSAENDFEETFYDYCPECPFTSRSEIRTDEDAELFIKWIKVLCHRELIMRVSLHSIRLIHKLVKKSFLYEIGKIEASRVVS